MEAPAIPLHGGNRDARRENISSLSSSNNNNYNNKGVVGGAALALTNARKQEESVRKFASLMGTKPGDNQSAALPQAARSKGLAALLSKTVADDEVVLVLPSLDMRLSEENGKHGAGALPKLGETKDSTGPVLVMNKPGEIGVEVGGIMGRPDMAASVLTAASNKAAKVEEQAAIEMNKRTSWTRSTVVYASQAVAANASEFFAKLIDSRLRAWTLLLLRHSLSTGDSQSRTRLLSMLSASIQVKKAETHFKTLALPDSAAGQAKEADVILPLLFEVVLHLTIQDKPEAITLRAPGTISAYFDNSKAITKVSTRIDTGVMLTAMVDHARIIVFKAVANATKTPVPPSPLTKKGSPASARNTEDSNNLASSTESSATSSPSPPIIAQPQVGNPSSLSRFRSALNLSTVQKSGDESPSLQKARCSALRLNSVLSGKGGDAKSASLGPRRTRSVKWDSPLQLPRLTSALAPSPKKQRMAENTARLKSFKSFGRPHAGDFGSGPRNATFGEYGGRAHLWGRDGKMAHHPAPMQGMGPMSDQIGLTGVADKNATFDFSFKSTRKPTVSLGGSPAGAPAIPRTTTGLEKWLINKTSRR